MGERDFEAWDSLGMRGLGLQGLAAALCVFGRALDVLGRSKRWDDDAEDWVREVTGQLQGIPPELVVETLPVDPTVDPL